MCLKVEYLELKILLEREVCMMSVSIPQSAGGSHGSAHPARGAWIALATFPIAVIVAVVVIFTIGGLLDLDMFNDWQWTGWQYLLVYGAGSIVVIAPLAVGTALSLEPARLGSRSWKWALIVNGTMLAVVSIGSVYGLITAVINRV
jgi:hypothetical protein